MSGQRNRRAKKQAAARAREGRARLRIALDELRIIQFKQPLPNPECTDMNPNNADDSESVCSWEGGVESWSDAESDLAEWIDDNNLRGSDDNPECGSGDGTTEDEEVIELEGDELHKSLERSECRRQERLRSAYDVLMREMSAKDWKKAEHTKRMGVYTGQSARTKRHRKLLATEDAKKDAKTRETYVLRSESVDTLLTGFAWAQRNCESLPCILCKQRRKPSVHSLQAAPKAIRLHQSMTAAKIPTKRQ